MSLVEVARRPDGATPDRGRPLDGAACFRVAGPLTAVTAALLQARRVLEAQTGGTLVLRANAVVCRALKDTATITAFTFWTGPGI